MPKTAQQRHEKVYVIIPAAGVGSRIQLPRNKIFLQLGRYPVIVRTMKTLESMHEVKGYIVVTAQGDWSDMQELVKQYGLNKCLGLARGGLSRQESVGNGLDELSNKILDLSGSMVLIHDGARCFVTPAVIRRVIDGIVSHTACGAAVAVKDTIKEADADGLVTETKDRSRLWAMQTPQGAWYPLLHEAYALARANGWQSTDDLSLLEQAGIPVHLTAGDYRNIKLTTPEDLLLGEILATITDQYI